jgi:hypothetical protein
MLAVIVSPANGPAHLVDEQQARDDSECADQTAERSPPRHRGDPCQGWQWAGLAPNHASQKRDDWQERDQTSEPRIVSELRSAPFIGGPQACNAPATRMMG